MTVGTDIKDALAEVGVALTIFRDSGNISGEYIDISPNFSQNNAYNRELCVEASFPYDTQAIPGDIVSIPILSKQFLVLSKSQEVLENAIIERPVLLLKCNVSGEILRESGEVYDASYNEVISWQTVKSNAYATLTTQMLTFTMSAIGSLEKKSLKLFIPANYNIKSLDKYVVDAVEYYKVETVDKRSYENVYICELTEDTRS